MILPLSVYTASQTQGEFFFGAELLLGNNVDGNDSVQNAPLENTEVQRYFGYRE
jgi:hypothetical protein